MEFTWYYHGKKSSLSLFLGEEGLGKGTKEKPNVYLELCELDTMFEIIRKTSITNTFMYCGTGKNRTH